MSDCIPSIVQQRARTAEKATGQPARIEQLGPTRWRVTVSNDTVEASADYAKAPNSRRYANVSGQLLVNGEERPTVATDGQLAKLFGKAPTPPEPEPVPTDRGIGDAPGEVLYFCQKALKGQPAVVGGTADGRLWVVRVQFPRGWVETTLHYTARGQHLKNAGGMRVVLDGVDVTCRYAHRLHELLSDMAGGQDPNGPATISGPGEAVESNAVRVRRQTVIRV